MSDSRPGAWSRSAPAGATPRAGLEAVRFGPDIGSEAELRLLGNLADRRVLELGCGTGEAAVALAGQGAHVIGVGSSGEQLVAARRLAEREGVKLELRQGDLADLAFVRADSIDLVLSIQAFAFAEDVNRVFRQVHRVLKESAMLVFSVPHPVSAIVDDSDADLPPVVTRSYYDGSPLDGPGGRPPGHRHYTVSDLLTGLNRANFRIETVLEPRPRPDGPRSPHWRPVMEWVPPTLVVRARKEGL